VAENWRCKMSNKEPEGTKKEVTNMQMTDGEIRRRYKEADKKSDIIKILSELNACPTDTIKRILNGNDKTNKRPVSYNLKQRNEMYIKLYKEGKSDYQIAKECDVGSSAIWSWRKKQNLPSNNNKKAEEAWKLAAEWAGLDIEEEPPKAVETIDTVVYAKEPYVIHIDLARDSDYHVISEWEYKNGKQTLKRCTITKT
jgi:soluble P-type ATPase